MTTDLHWMRQLCVATALATPPLIKATRLRFSAKRIAGAITVTAIDVVR